jgi:transglutaminase-like putative cysteine protease
MRFEITHRTRYCFSHEVILEPHIFRFRPRSDGNQRLLDYRIGVEPEPSLLSDCLDLEGNAVTRAWFQTPTDALYIHTWSLVETTRTNPFDFVLSHQDATAIPLLYPEEMRSRLAPYCDSASIDWEVRALSDSVANEANWDTLRFLPALTERIFTICRHERRASGNPQPAAITLSSKQGACRDLTVLFIDACRAQGLAARFVSGYQRSSEEWERHEMHAWAEVYLPGGGWRGFDPSHGLALADQLVAVAAAADSRGAAPVTGTFLGAGIESSLEFEIELR